MSSFVYLSDIAAEERLHIEKYARPIGVALKKKGKTKIVLPYKRHYLLIFLLDKKLILVSYVLTPDLLVIGHPSPIEINIQATQEDPSYYRPGYKSRFAVNTLDNDSITIQSISQLKQLEFPITRTADATLFDICNAFTEVVNNSNITYSHLLCVSNNIVLFNADQWTAIFPFKELKSGIKLMKMFNIAQTLSDKVTRRKLSTGIIYDLSTRYAYRSYAVNEDYLGVRVHYLNNPELDFIAQRFYDEHADVYDFDKAIDYFDASDLNNPAVTTVTASIKYDKDYFFDVSEIEQKVNNFTPELEDILPGNVRYLFDVPIDNTGSSGRLLYDSIAFYFEGGTLKYRILWSAYALREYVILIHNFTINKAANFETSSLLEVSFIITKGEQELVDLNIPTQVPVEHQFLYSYDDIYDGFDQGFFQWFKIEDQLSYGVVLTIDDYTVTGEPIIGNVASLVSTAAALPTKKTSLIPLLCTSWLEGVPYTGTYVDHNYENITVTNGKILYNGYITDFTYRHVFHSERVWASPGVLISQDHYYSSIGTGLPVEDNLITYTISTDFFGDTIVRTETATSTSSIYVTNEDAVVSFYIIPKEDIAAYVTDISSLLLYVKTLTPVAVIETLHDMEDYFQWHVNTPDLNISTGTAGYEQSYPAGVFEDETLWEAYDPFAQYGSLTLASNVRYPIGVVSYTDNYNYENVQFLPNIYVLSDNMHYTWVTTADTNARRFHRIYLTDANFNRIGRCDLLWSMAFQEQLASFVQHHPAAVDIVVDKGNNEDPLLSSEETALIEAKNAYTEFNTLFLDSILYNDFASYELIYYLFGADVINKLPPMVYFNEDVVMILTTADIENL